MTPPHQKYQRLLEFCKTLPPTPTAVVHPCDESSLRGAIEAAQLGLIAPILVGPRARIEAVATEHGIALDGIPIVDAPYSEASAAKAVELVREGKAEALMKGSLHTDELMGAIVRRDTGLRTATFVDIAPWIATCTGVLQYDRYGLSLTATEVLPTGFADLGLDEHILRAIADAGYTQPTAIQAGAIPMVLAGRDVIGIAQTGTGKTASFVLPMLHVLGNGRARVVGTAREAVEGADIVVTDTWISMGQEHADTKLAAMMPFQVTGELMAGAKPGAKFLHCLPAHRGEEVTAEVLDGPQSLIWPEAENRLHAQKSILRWCFEQIG